MADRKRLAIAFVASISLLTNAGFAFRHHEPIPVVTDEFAFLLGAETFVHGRLTNPTHPMWRHFETEGVIQRPTYQSKYPPGQSLFLALGQVLTGKPIVGVWIALALACGALCWMLQAWMGPRLALLGSLLAALSPVMVEGWGQSYWGGGVAMLGGALLFGAVRRMARSPRPSHGIAAGFALALLANSRPLEGLLATVAASLVLIFPRFRDVTVRRILSRVVLPAAVVLLPVGAWVGYYNYRVTGSALEFPYQAWYRSYVGGSGSLFDVATQVNPPELPERVVRGIRPLKIDPEELSVRIERLEAKRTRMIAYTTGFYFPAVLLITLAGLPWALGDRWVLFGLVTLLSVMAMVFSGFTAWAPHYSAPVAPLVYVLLTAGFRQIGRLQWKRRPMGAWIQVAMLASFLVHTAAELREPAFVWQDKVLAMNRDRIERILESIPGKHLVMVHYAEDRRASWEWVFNRARINRAKIVWARFLGPKRNQELLGYFSDRRVWLIRADEPAPVVLREYPSGK
jgi:MFS family permease